MPINQHTSTPQKRLESLMTSRLDLERTKKKLTGAFGIPLAKNGASCSLT